MIDTSQIRIGNLLKDHHGRIVTVDEIKRHSVRCLYTGLQNTETEGIRNSNFSAEDLEGVELNEEWLAKFGFKEGEYSWHTIAYYTDLMEANEEYCMTYNTVSHRLSFYETSENEYQQYPIHTKSLIYYVHQIQNLYFAITGNELTISL